MTVYSLSVFRCKKRSKLCENTQDSRIHFLYNNFKTTVKLPIAVVRGISDCKTPNMYASHFYCTDPCNSTALCKKNKEMKTHTVLLDIHTILQLRIVFATSIQ